MAGARFTPPPDTSRSDKPISQFPSGFYEKHAITFLCVASQVYSLVDYRLQPQVVRLQVTSTGIGHLSQRTMATNNSQVLPRTDLWTDAAITRTKCMGLMKTNQKTTLKSQNKAKGHILKNKFNLLYTGFNVHLDNKSQVYDLCYFF